MTERDRATTKGVEVVANSGLIQSDINNFEHVPVKREKQSGKSGNQFQDGFLVIGIAAVTFLDKTKSVVSSHPLSHVDYYFREGDKGFTYNIQMRNVAKKGQKVKFAFIAESPEKAQFLLASMDKYIFENKVDSKGGKSFFFFYHYLCRTLLLFLLPLLQAILVVLLLVFLLELALVVLVKCLATTSSLLGTLCFTLSAEVTLLQAARWREFALLDKKVLLPA